MTVTRWKTLIISCLLLDAVEVLCLGNHGHPRPYVDLARASGHVSSALRTFTRGYRPPGKEAFARLLSLQFRSATAQSRYDRTRVYKCAPYPVLGPRRVHHGHDREDGTRALAVSARSSPLAWP